MLGQNGRLLLRLDELDEQIAAVADGQPIAAAAAKPAKPAEPVRGLPVGSSAPGFKLEGIHGETMTLDALRAQGKPVMLVFSDPNCGPCNALMPELGAWQKEHGANLTIAVLSRGTAAVNQEKAVKAGLSQMLLQKDREISEAYQAFGTPSAVLVSPDGKVASPVEGGADRIRELLKTTRGSAPAPAARTVAQPAAPAPAQAPTNGAPRPAEAAPPRPHMSDPAPDFVLNDLDGKQVRLADFKGRDSVLIFWSPTCGFCKRMADDITAWEANPQAGAPQAVIITSGDLKLNRDFGFKSTVLMDPATDTMKKYGTGGTPTAILVDANGNIASQMRVGQPGVMSLLRGEEAPAAPPPPPAPKTIKIGDPAPAVKLNDLKGNAFDLDSLKGEKALMVFWNPGCGFCKRMTDDLKQWESVKPADAPNIVLVSTGTIESNAEQGLTSTVLIDQGFNVGRSFGASGTPSAVLIDEQGRVASDVAVGAPKVLALAGAPQTV
jgi:peroxiredoxin